jgi:acyl-CoA synthetase (AMP-forming)/AMP-acid ligase II
MAHLWTVIAEAVRQDTSLYLPMQDQRVGLHEILERAERTAARLLAIRHGREPRRVGILMANGEPWLRGLLAVARLDATAVPLPLPVSFAGHEQYLAHLQRIAADASLDAVLVDRTMGGAMTRRLTQGLAGVDLVDITELDGGPLRRPTPSAGDEELAIIQYTSGSTAATKGVMLTHRNIAAGLRAVTEALGWTDGDAFGLWIPLFHDMGLFSLLSGLARGSSACLWQPGDFVRKPISWLQSFTESPATVQPAPNFFYDHLAAAAGTGVPSRLDLSRWRVACNGAEPVRYRTLEWFQQIFGPYGLRDSALNPVYGMAEATLIVTGPDPGGAWRSMPVDRDRLGVGETVQVVSTSAENARDVVSCGHAVPGIRVRVADADGRPYAEDTVGEVQITGAAVTAGYLGLARAQQPFTPDGWLRTGDLAFLHDRELFVVGRLKDMIIVRGQNYYAEDVEELVATTPGVARLRNVAIPWDDGDAERIVVLLETSLTGTAAAELAATARSRVAMHIGMPAVEVVPVPLATIPRTTSGKVRRHEAVRIYQSRYQ